VGDLIMSDNNNHKEEVYPCVVCNGPIEGFLENAKRDWENKHKRFYHYDDQQEYYYDKSKDGKEHYFQLISSDVYNKEKKAPILSKVFEFVEHLVDEEISKL
jgi:hypothetical protein